MLLLSPAYADHIRLTEETTLFYTCTRVGTSASAPSSTWNASIEVLTFNQTALILQSNTTESTSTVNLKYSGGIPTYADYVTALFYLPPECMAQSLLGNLNWTARLTTHTPAVVANWTSNRLNFTVDAGSFESLNVTLTLAGMDSGELTLIYDVDSGIMIYEQWIPISGSQLYGDIIVLSLNTVTSPHETPQTIINLALTIAVFATPTAMFLQEVSKSLQRRHRARRLGPSNIRAKEGSLGKPFYVIVAGSLLNLASTVLPWSQLAGSWVYLPLSLSSTLAGYAALLTSTSTLLAISLMVQASAIVAWVSIALQVYTGNRVAPKVMTIASGVLALVSPIIFIQTDWTTSFGPPVIVVAGILALTGTSLAIMTTKKENRSISSVS
jgi:hypothetical protein